MIMTLLATIALQTDSSTGGLSWSTLLPILNGIVGGTVMALVAWLVGTGKLTLGRETQGFKDLWTQEKTARELLEKDRDKLVEDLRRNNDVLSSTVKAATDASAALAQANTELRLAFKGVDK